jgi:hypothetical protein
MPTTSEPCKWLHEALEALPLFKYPFKLDALPRDGIYFFYEEGEVWGHGGDKPRVVRVGINKRGTLRKRIAQHYLVGRHEHGTRFDRNQAKPSDFSIFRKNIGRALLNMKKDPYLPIWSKKGKEVVEVRDVEKERKIEEEVTKVIRERFYFRAIEVPSRELREELERALIGTLAKCDECRPSPNWLGRFSPIPKISGGKLWVTQYLNESPITKRHQEVLTNLIEATIKHF